MKVYIASNVTKDVTSIDGRARDVLDASGWSKRHSIDEFEKVDDPAKAHLIIFHDGDDFILYGGRYSAMCISDYWFD